VVKINNHSPHILLSVLPEDIQGQHKE